MPDDLSPQALAGTLDGLAASRSQGRVNVRLVQDDPYVAVGRDFAGRAVVVLEPLDGAAAFRVPHAELLPATDLTYDDGAGTGPPERRGLLFYDEDALGGAYRELLPSLVWGLVDARRHHGEHAAVEYVAGLARLLREAADPVDADAAQGLWGELLIISLAPDPAVLVDAWHEDPDETYDFARGNDRLEVKTARGGRRRHRFSDTQIPPPAGTDVTVASVKVQRAAGGATAIDLIVGLKDRLSPADHELLVRKTLAVMPLTHLLDRAYDRDHAAAAVRFVDASLVPAALLEPHVLEASWLADLAQVPPRAAPAGSLLAAALP